MLDLINCGGNIGSITRCFKRLGVEYSLVESGDELSGENPLALPGVGSFGALMNNLDGAGITEKLVGLVKSGVPLLGICVGLQVLFETSEESPETPGLGIIKGGVVRFREGKIPQIGWNRIEPKAGSGFESGYVYFVNSYYAAPQDDEVTLYHADYHGQFCAAVKSENILAFQFHPEKSGEFGHGLIRRWLDDL
ncbi:MAG: imidazole glycerol phosphate synthase subunit HisH [Planctomycetota bacterium]|nr:MAG: imidazole glycerol phosphate synthase subunit HisH [Planctomycetota bacterium]